MPRRKATGSAPVFLAIRSRKHSTEKTLEFGPTPRQNENGTTFSWRMNSTRMLREAVGRIDRAVDRVTVDAVLNAGGSQWARIEPPSHGGATP